jgi:[ribosomal protein S18]-alanine N-acetyltransferase
MITYTILFNEKELNKISNKDKVAEFLYQNLDEFRDEQKYIIKAIEHALGYTGVKGGFILLALEEGKIIGALVMNRTGMSGYIPENIMVYVAVSSDHRGKGIGRKIVEQALANAQGDVKLHVEYNNPAKRLYERIGFTTKYAEMRYKKG